MEKKINIILPSIPNFILGESGTSFDVASLSDADLRKIGRDWTKALVEKAQKRRNFLIAAAMKSI